MIFRFIIAILSINIASANCGVTALYHEARSEGKQGMIEVANVILNRVKSKHYPNTVCGVVRHHKQFSYHPTKIKTLKDVQYMEKKYPRIHKVKDWKLATKVWHLVVSKKAKVKFRNATHYHTVDVSPEWGLRRLGRYKRHIFYGAKL